MKERILTERQIQAFQVKLSQKEKSRAAVEKYLRTILIPGRLKKLLLPGMVLRDLPRAAEKGSGGPERRIGGRSCRPPPPRLRPQRL